MSHTTQCSCGDGLKYRDCSGEIRCVICFGGCRNCGGVHSAEVVSHLGLAGEQLTILLISEPDDDTALLEAVADEFATMDSSLDTYLGLDEDDIDFGDDEDEEEDEDDEDDEDEDEDDESHDYDEYDDEFDDDFEDEEMALVTYPLRFSRN